MSHYIEDQPTKPRIRGKEGKANKMGEHPGRRGFCKEMV
jgi:hypothetical protein